MNPKISLSLLACGLVLSLSALAEPATTIATDARSLTPEAIPMVTWTPPAAATAPTLKPTVWMDRSDLLYRPGETASAYVRVNQEAYVTVINVDANGATTVLFPNQFSPNNRITANTTLELGTERSGFRLRVSEPYGGNLLKVLASAEPMDWTAGRTTARSGAFQTLSDKADTFARHLTAVAATAKTGVAATEIVFGVVPASQSAAAVAQPAPPVPPIYQTPGAQPAVVAAPPVSTPVAPPAPATQGPIPTTTSDFGFRLTGNKTSYATGEKLQLEAVAERRCSLILLDVRPDGSYELLYPNAVDEELWLEEGKTAFISATDSELKVEADGAGPHTLLGLCTARRTWSQFFFGKSGERTNVVAKKPTLAEVMAERPKGDSASARFDYIVAP